MTRTPRRERRFRALVLVLAAASLCGSCRSTGAAPRSDEPAIFTLVLLRTGESPPTLTSERQAELFDGHFAFMAEEAEAGRLLLAGPYGANKSAADLRGILVLDEDDAERALEIASGDPTSRAGVFRQEAYPLATLGVLRELPAIEQRRQEAREAAGEDMSVPDVERFVLMISDAGEAAVQVLGHPAFAPHVVLFGRLGPPRDGALFSILAIDGAREASARLAIANEAGVPFELSDWYGTPSLLELGAPDRSVAGRGAEGDQPRTSSSSK